MRRRSSSGKTLLKKDGFRFSLMSDVNLLPL